MKIAYIDTQNIHKGILELGWKIDWKKLFLYLHQKFELNSVKIFIGYMSRYEDFYQKLRDIGYEVIFKETLILPSGEVKGNVDIDIAIHVMQDMYENSLGKAYLLTGDGDYNTLVDMLKMKGKLGRIMIPNRKQVSKLLKKSAGADIQSLEDLKYLLKLDDEDKNTIKEKP